MSALLTLLAKLKPMSKHNSQQPPSKSPLAYENRVSERKGQQLDSVKSAFKHCEHDGKQIDIGGYQVRLGGCMHIPKAIVYGVDIICPLNGQMPHIDFGRKITMVSCELQDYGGVPPQWEAFIQHIAASIKAGKKVLGYCMGGHGRTGTFAASLISVLEPETEDPIAAIRERYCKKAVETLKQADAVFKFRGMLAPQKYADEFEKKFETKWGKGQGHMWGGFKGKEDKSTIPFEDEDLVWDTKLKIWRYPEDETLSTKYQQSKQLVAAATASDEESLVFVPELGKYVSLSEIEKAWEDTKAL